MFMFVAPLLATRTVLSVSCDGTNQIQNYCRIRFTASFVSGRGRHDSPTVYTGPLPGLVAIRCVRVMQTLLLSFEVASKVHGVVGVWPDKCMGVIGVLGVIERCTHLTRVTN